MLICYRIGNMNIFGYVKNILNCSVTRAPKLQTVLSFMAQYKSAFPADVDALKNKKEREW